MVGVNGSVQWSGTVPVGTDGPPIMNAVIWMDSRRTPPGEAGHRRDAEGERIRPAASPHVDPANGGAPTHSGMDSITHILWIKEGVPDVYRRTAVFLEPKDWLNLRLTGRAVSSFDAITLHCGTDTHKVDDVRYSDRLLAMAGPRPIEAARPRPDRLVARATHRRGGGRSGPARPGRARTTADGLSTPHITCGVLIPCWSCFSSPAINVYSRDVVRLVTFYEGLGFHETFRTPKDGTPDHVELVLDGFTIGIASVEAAIADHGLNPNLGGRPCFSSRRTG